MKRLNPIQQDHYRYKHIVGTGGIGTGIVFFLETNETLGRNESRAAILLPYKDYCKQHIILHYIAVLLGAAQDDLFGVYPIGKIGQDEAGMSLLTQMQVVGMNTRYVDIASNAATMFSVCFQYPDRSGGNITTDNSASSQMSEQDIEKCISSITNIPGSEIILAVPEVPLAARIALLKQGRKRNSFNIASFLSAEAVNFIGEGGIQLTDLLSINMDEAQQIIGRSSDTETDRTIIGECIEKLIRLNPALSVIITNGSKGVYCFTAGELYEYPSLVVPVVSTAGAGDAFLAGTICGICCGLPLAGEVSPNGSLNTAVQLGILLAAFSVTSPDSIHGSASARTLFDFSASTASQLGKDFQQLFQTQFNI